MKVTKNITLILAAAMLLLAAACSPFVEASPATDVAPTMLPPAQDELAATQWQLGSYGTVGAETPVLDTTTLTLAFDTAGQVAGQGGCNSFDGKYKADSQTVTFTEMVHTMRACVDDAANQQEAAYIGAFDSAGKYELNGDQLTIYYDGGASALHFTKA